MVVKYVHPVPQVLLLPVEYNASLSYGKHARLCLGQDGLLVSENGGAGFEAFDPECLDDHFQCARGLASIVVFQT